MFFVVEAFLRDKGYNAAISKTKWEKSGGVTVGNYEFIDVVHSDFKRYFIDLDFASEFVIARPTNIYENLLQYLPRVYVGKTEDLKHILKVISDAAKQSQKSGDGGAANRDGGEIVVAFDSVARSGTH
ncbi:Sulfate thiosulfate import ATP-binding cysA [Olea europaea subsp. europaea]|uniref:Sulfate thiosulfate import ATP-binding cysA n=1 Tax=Olea europaea subsp. europaea TaxID=158383 RepID=A0A8S0SY75_OLEEU|nr:Sulfate thiosulfate import ATP-binding cysA [Olea europaea subsp. europaea]